VTDPRAAIKKLGRATDGRGSDAKNLLKNLF